MIRTKGEIASSETIGIFDEDEINVTGLSDAMDIYAKQQAIAFVKWLKKEGYREYDESDRWISIEKSNTVYTTKQLYEKFEKENKNV